MHAVLRSSRSFLVRTRDGRLPVRLLGSTKTKTVLWQYGDEDILRSGRE